MVSIPTLNIGTVADANGYFLLQDIPEGTQEMTVSYIGYEAMTTSVEVAEGTTMLPLLKFQEIKALNEVVVWGNASGQNKAINQQKASDRIVNVISSDQIGRFPDSNIGDAMKRIPGVYVQYDQGEARFANIRGTAPQLNSITINGERIPSAEAEIRSVQLDLVPADMIQMVEVSKAVTPDMDGDAIGGSVNLQTRVAPADRRVSATLGSGYNFIANKPMLNGSLIYGDRFANDKLGVIVSASVFDHHLGSDNIEGEWDGEQLKEFQVRQYYLQRLRQSYSLGADYKLNDNHTLYLQGMYNHRNDWENRYRLRFDDLEYNEETDTYEAEIRRETKGGANDKNRRLEDQRVYNASLSGDHIFGALTADWKVKYAKASETRPQERYITYRQKGQTVAFDLNDPYQPTPSTTFPEVTSAWDFKEITEENQYTEEEDLTARLNLNWSIAEGEFASKLKFGGKYKLKKKLRDNEFFEFEPIEEDSFFSTLALEDVTKDNYQAGNYAIGQFVSAETLGGLDLSNESLFEKSEVLEEIAGNFNAEEAISAGYISLNQRLGNKLSMVAGVRMEHTQVRYQGFVYQAEFEDQDENLTATGEQTDFYTNWMPGIHLKYEPVQNLLVRAAWTNTIARPNYFDLVPYQQIFREDNELAIGNPALSPTTSMNYDLMGEYYLKSLGLFTAGAFVKQIDDFIVEQVSDEVINGTEYEVTQPINGGDALIAGVEMGIQKRLTFLPFPLNRLNVYSNYTYTFSEVSNFQIEDREDEVIALPGTAAHAFNGSLFYDSKKLNVGVSFNYTSAFIDELGDEPVEDRYYDQVFYLDANANYQVTPQLRIFAEANNLLNQPLRYYQGSVDRTMQIEYYAPRFSFGAKFDL
ncbi:TonB-dependent receptor [Algivirga pacifica]|uniref:TonB-dependent receptor n=2 Tax=Algivirga pacifica TaxID=1162670 RepID=A0ABP9DE10_9BACT